MPNVFWSRKTFLAFAFILYGFAALTIQLVLLRELSILFYANELFIGFSLGAWLLWVGAGSYAGRKQPGKQFPLFYALIAPTLLIEIYLIRLTKLLFGYGMIVGPIAMVFTTAALLFPIGTVIGAVFSTGCGFAKARYGTGPSNIYFLETIGAVLSGIFYTACFAGRLSNFAIAVSIAALTLPTSLLLIEKKNKSQALIFISAMLAAIFLSIPAVNQWTLKREWRGYQLLTTHDSRYGNLAVTQTGSLRQLFQDGLISASFPDPTSHEEIIHLPLLAHPNPGRVLLIGAGVTGELSEILKHPVQAVDYIEIDRTLIETLKPFIDKRDLAALSDQRAAIHYEDGRAYSKKTKNSYDAIILNLPPPQSAQINRFYTEEFFKELRVRLNAGGLVALKIPSSENYLPPQVLLFNRSIFRTLQSVFKHITIVPGQSLILIGHDEELTLKPQTLTDRYHRRNLKNILVVPSYFPIKLDPDRIDFFETQLTHSILAPMNRDFRPVSYFYLWQTWLLKFQKPLNLFWLLTSLLVIFTGLKQLAKKRYAILKTPENVLIFALGFSGITYETVIILAFQATVGYVYWQLGFLFAAFMTGLAWGSRFGQKIQKPTRAIAFVVLAQSFYGIILGFLLIKGTGTIPFDLLPSVFYLSMIPVGAMLGLGFTTLVRSKSADAGTLYASDLWGSSLGAILTGLFLIPFLGFARLLLLTCLGLLLAATLLRQKI